MSDRSHSHGLDPVSSELILGGQKSGKSRRAEHLARAWLDANGHHRAVLIATATAVDAEMLLRIERHRTDRAACLPDLRTIEEPLALAEAVLEHSRPGTLVLVDCLTLWLTNRFWPNQEGRVVSTAVDDAPDAQSAIDTLVAVIAAARGPLVLVSNEIGCGVIPLGRQVRAFVDALGQLNQAAARQCDRVTLMVAGMPLTVKGAP